MFTSGVLIHIPSYELERVMKMIIEGATDYVLAVEYASPVEEMIEYRGEKDLLWKRPYGGLYCDMGLSLIESGPAEGWTDCTYWLLRKP